MENKNFASEMKVVLCKDCLNWHLGYCDRDGGDREPRDAYFFCSTWGRPKDGEGRTCSRCTHLYTCDKAPPVGPHLIELTDCPSFEWDL